MVSPSVRSRTALAAAFVTLLSASGVLALAGPAAASDTGLVVSASLNGHSLTDSGSNDPIALHADAATLVSVTMTNKGSSPVDVAAVGLNSRVLGMPFLSYTTLVNVTVAPGATETRSFVLNAIGLDGQATGLLPASVSLLTLRGKVLASTDGALDVKGNLWSVYGVFGLAVGAITALLLVTLVFRLVRRTLPESRWARAIRFAAPGLGFGLTLTFTLSVLRVLVPSSGPAFAMLVGGLLIGFGLGYLTPNPADEADRDELDERDIVRAGAGSNPVPGFDRGPAPTTASLGAPATIDLNHPRAPEPARETESSAAPPAPPGG